MILKGIRVLDFTQYLAGPTVTRLMAEMGADIIKIERAPLGDPARLLPAIKDGRSGYFVQQNLGKRSLCIDLNHGDADALIHELVEKVDVVVENFGPGVMQRRGWDFDALLKINAKLIMASVSAFGRTGPLAHKTGFDWIAQAFAGIMHMTGPADGPPHPVGVGMADISTGVHAFASIGYALFHRERTGEGQYMDISMIDSLFHLHEINLQVHQLTDGEFVPKRMGRHHTLLCPCGVFKAHQGYVAILVTQGQWAGMCKALGQPELENDPRFDSLESRAANQNELIPLVEAWLQTFPNDQGALDVLEENRVPSAPVLSPLDALGHEYFEGRGTIRTVTDPILGEMKLPGFPLRFSSQQDYSAGVAPLLGQHNEAVLEEVLGWDQAKVAAQVEAGLLASGDR
ncbi:MAG: CoA transferase [Gammaproteobacteria bacterium]|nr:CoA transferase [Gammaproteobacteria bacterium]